MNFLFAPLSINNALRISRNPLGIYSKDLKADQVYSFAGIARSIAVSEMVNTVIQ